MSDQPVGPIIRKQVVVLEVEYEPFADGFTEMNPAAEWNWNDLTGEKVTVIAAGPEIETDLGK